MQEEYAVARLSINLKTSLSANIRNDKFRKSRVHLRDCSLFVGSTGPVFQGMGQGLSLMFPSMGRKDFLCFYGTGHERFLEKYLSNYICITSRGGNSHGLGYHMCHF